MRLVTAIGRGSHLAHAGAGLLEGLSEPFTRTHAVGKVRSCPRWPETAGGILAR